MSPTPEASAPPAAGGASSSIPESPSRRGRWWVRVAFLLLGAALLAGIAELATKEPDRDLIRISGIGDAQRIFGGMAQDGERLGATDADLVITVFNDVQCSTCASYFLRTTPPLVDELARSGEAKLIYRSYSFSSAAQELGFFGAAAAGEQGYLWQYVYLFFRNQDEARREGVTDRFLQTIAGAIGGVDLGQWRDDFEQGLEPDSAMRARLERDGQLADQLDVRARPAALIAGPRGSELLQESPSLTEIEAALDSVR